MGTNEMWVVIIIAILAVIIGILAYLLISTVKAKRNSKEGEEERAINIYINKDGSVSAPAKVNVVAEKKEEPAKVAEEPAPQGNVFLSKAAKLEFAEELKKCNKSTKDRYKKLLDLFSSFNAKVRTNESKYRVLIKYGTYRLCEIKFMRGILKASFYIASSDFKLYSRTNDNMPIVEKPTLVDLTNEDSYEPCCKLAELAFNQAKDAVAHK